MEELEKAKYKIIIDALTGALMQKDGEALVAKERIASLEKQLDKAKKGLQAPKGTNIETR